MFVARSRFRFAVLCVLIASTASVSALAKQVEIKCRFDDGGRMPGTIRIKLEVWEGTNLVGFGNDSSQHKFIKCIANPSDAASTLILILDTTKADEWLVDPHKFPVPSDQPVSRSLLIFHRTSVLNAQLDAAEGVTVNTLPAAKEALAKAEPLLRVSAERARWARAQDKVFELEGVDPASRQAAFSKALNEVNRDVLPRAERVALTQQEFDLLKGAVNEMTVADSITEAIESDFAPLPSGKTPKEELTVIATHAAKATGKSSLKNAAAEIDRGSAKAVRDVAKSLHRSIDLR
jgi:hypothetical protein